MEVRRANDEIRMSKPEIMRPLLNRGVQRHSTGEMCFGGGMKTVGVQPSAWLHRDVSSSQTKACTPTDARLSWAGMFLILFVFGCAAGQAATPPRDLSVLIVVGASGAPEYKGPFEEEAKLLQEACAKASVSVEVIGLGAELAPDDAHQTDAVHIQAWTAKAAATPKRAAWIFLIGHGTYDGRDAKFNLRGPDITAADLAEWLNPLTGEVALIQTASASAPFVKALAGPGRVLVSATKSADEVFYTRFGRYFARAISGELVADLDRDAQVSLLEAFLWASKQVDRFFETEGRLATEHALIEDNGDGIGTRADAFTSLRLTNPPAPGQQQGDGLLARQRSLLLNQEDAALTEEQRHRRDDLERQVEALRIKRSDMPESEYYAQLEKVLLEIARLGTPE